MVKLSKIKHCRKKQIFSVLFVFLFSVFLLFMSGCDEELRTKEEIVSLVTTHFPEAELVNYEESGTECLKRVYDFKFKDITFTITEEQLIQLMFATKMVSFEDTFSKSLAEYFNEEKLYSISEKAEELNVTTSYDHNGIEFWCDVDSYKEIPDAIDTFEEIYNEVYEYLPETSFHYSDVCTNIGFYIDFPNEARETYDYPYKMRGWGLNEKIGLENIRSKEDSIDWEEEEKVKLMDYKVLIDDGLIVDEDFVQNVYSEVPSKYFFKLFIDGEEFICENYYYPLSDSGVVSDPVVVKLAFVYDMKTETYLALVGYDECFKGYQYLIKAIIEEYYTNTNFSEEDGVVKYSINNTVYSLKEGSKGEVFKGDKSKICVNKWDLTNSENQIVNTCKSIAQMKAKPRFSFISIDDFADIVGMKVDKIDVENRAVYLVTNN